MKTSILIDSNGSLEEGSGNAFYFDQLKTAKELAEFVKGKGGVDGIQLYSEEYDTLIRVTREGGKYSWEDGNATEDDKKFWQAFGKPNGIVLIDSYAEALVDALNEKLVIVSMADDGGATEQSEALEIAIIEWAQVVELDDGVDKEVADFVDRLTQVMEDTTITDVVAEIARRLKQAR